MMVSSLPTTMNAGGNMTTSSIPTAAELAARAAMEIESKNAAIDSKYGSSSNAAKVEYALSQVSANKMEFSYE